MDQELIAAEVALAAVDSEEVPAEVAAVEAEALPEVGKRVRRFLVNRLFYQKIGKKKVEGKNDRSWQDANADH